MKSHLIVDIKRFEVLDQNKLEELEALLEEKNLYSKDLILILNTLKIPEVSYKPLKYKKTRSQI